MTTIDKLPAHARQKALALEQAADDADALARSVYAAIVGCERQLSPLENIRASSNPQRAKEAQAEIDVLESELKRLRALQRLRSHRAGIDRQTAVQVRAWVTQLPPHVRLEAAPPPKTIAVLAGAKGVEAIRRDIQRLKAELEAVELAPLPLADLKAKVRAMVDDLAERGRPVIRIERAGFDLKWSRPSGMDPGSAPSDAAAFAAWMQPELLIARFEQEIDDAASRDAGPSPLSVADRAACSNELKAAILDAERLEESLLEGAPEIARRSDANPLAILGLQVAPAKEAEAA